MHLFMGSIQANELRGWIRPATRKDPLNSLAIIAKLLCRMRLVKCLKLCWNPCSIICDKPAKIPFRMVLRMTTVPLILVLYQIELLSLRSTAYCWVFSLLKLFYLVTVEYLCKWFLVFNKPLLLIKNTGFIKFSERFVPRKRMNKRDVERQTCFHVAHELFVV